LRDSLREEGHDAPATPDHVAVSHDHEPGRVGALPPSANSTFSASAFVIPMALTGLTALSVETDTTVFTPCARAARRMFSAPATLVRNRLHRTMLAIGDLLQRGGMINDVDASHRLHDGAEVGRPDGEAQPALVTVLILHVVLLLLIAAVDTILSDRDRATPG